LWLVGQAMTAFRDPASAANLLAGKGAIVAAMARWTLGEHVHGNRSRGQFIASLEPPPPDVWEMRIREPIVQARFIGFFAEPDTLVFAQLHTRGYLGKKGSAGWKDAMEAAVAEWERLFPGHRPFSGAAIGDYITEACDDFPI
jgi:hypothetical protein